ncbi:MAG: hypothetical protein MI863_08875 [Desulfobacterales bacterium]|nr:hypothetical protein [Desulfobacterales bacterium]
MTSEDKRKIPPGAMLVLFLLLIVLFLFTGFTGPPDPGRIEPLDAAWYTPETARAEVLKAKTLVGNCFICHMGMVPDPAVRQPRFNHKSISLNHGRNDRCYNCHLIYDRNLFTPDYGPGITDRQVQELCARCHGVIYNDWLNGIHGAAMGLWQDPTPFNTTAFVCTQCHDPHSPRFEFKTYAPAPVWPEKFIRYSAGDDKPESQPAAKE